MSHDVCDARHIVKRATICFLVGMARIISLLIVFGLWMSADAAHAQSDPDEKALHFAATEGLAIYAHDQAAWHGTDAFLEVMDDVNDAEWAGWVVSEDPDNEERLRVSFIDGAVEPPASAVDVFIQNSEVRDLRINAPRRALDASERIRRAGVQAMIAYVRDPGLDICRDFLPMNHVVLPKSDNPADGYRGYLFAATKQPGVIVLGRHFTFDLDANGVVTREPTVSTKSCFAISYGDDADDGVEDDSVVAAVAATHVTSNHPEPFHVFASLTHRVPVVVGVSKTDELYEVAGSDIRRISP